MHPFPPLYSDYPQSCMKPRSRSYKSCQALMVTCKALLAHQEADLHLEEGVLLTGRPVGGRQGWPHRCPELGVLCKEGGQGADAGAKIGLHLDEGTQPLRDLPLGPLILHANPWSANATEGIIRLMETRNVDCAMGLQPIEHLPLRALMPRRAACDVASMGLVPIFAALTMKALTLGCTQKEKRGAWICALVHVHLLGMLRCGSARPEADGSPSYPKALVCQDDGAVVMAMADDSPHGLVDCPGGLLRIPLLP